MAVEEIAPYQIAMAGKGGAGFFVHKENDALGIAHGDGTVHGLCPFVGGFHGVGIWDVMSAKIKLLIQTSTPSPPKASQQVKPNPLYATSERQMLPLARSIKKKVFEGDYEGRASSQNLANFPNLTGEVSLRSFMFRAHALMKSASNRSPSV